MTNWKVLTLKARWAWAICHAEKRVENRTWPVPAKYLKPCCEPTHGFAGCGEVAPLRVMIHSAKTPEPKQNRWYGPNGFQPDWLADMPGGYNVDDVSWIDLSEDHHGSGSFYGRWNARYLGAVVSVARITGQHTQMQCRGGVNAEPNGSCSPWAIYADRDGDDWGKPFWHWELADVQPLAEPVPAKGRLGLWKPSAEIIEAVEAQL